MGKRASQSKPGAGSPKSAKATAKVPASARATVQRQREIQQHIADLPERNDRKKSPVQAGTRKQPEKLPAQHIDKPGHESELDLAPRFMAPDYAGSGKLVGMNAIVTGGDSGIGRAVAVLYAREGANVAILHLAEPDDAEETRRCVEAEGVQALVIAGDVRDSAYCDKAVAQVVKAFGGVDILVNNAGFQQHAERLEDLTDAHLQETLDTNVAGYFHMARAVLPHMAEGDCIINCGSVTGLAGSPQLLDYSASKGAVHAFTKALAHNLLPRGIRVNAVAPGPVWTPFNPADKEAEDVAEFGMDSAMGRPAQPEELSPAFVFLASPVMSSYVNGIILPVTGGPPGS